MSIVPPLIANPIYKNTQAREAFLKALKRKKGEEANYVRTKEEIELAMQKAAEEGGFEYKNRDLKKLINIFKKFKIDDQKSGISNYDLAAYNQVKNFEPLFGDTEELKVLTRSTNGTGYLLPPRSFNELQSNWYKTATELGLRNLSDDKPMIEKYFLKKYSIRVKTTNGKKLQVKSADHFEDLKSELSNDELSEAYTNMKKKYEELKNDYLKHQNKYKIDTDAYDKLASANTDTTVEILTAIDEFQKHLSENYISREDLNIALNVFYPGIFESERLSPYNKIKEKN